MKKGKFAGTMRKYLQKGEINMGDYELVVVISRHPSAHTSSEILISEIEGIKWDNLSGGVNKKQSGYSLYGYIPYELAKKYVDCSGNHDYGYNMAKICIPESLNKDAKYIDGYNILCKLAGKKPDGVIKSKRPKGGKPCTKRILMILDEQEFIYRGELRTRLKDEGYKVIVRNALYSLRKQSKIKTEGSPYSPKQIIRKA